MSEPAKISDLTGNPWDDLSACEQRATLHRLSRETYRRWQGMAAESAVDRVRRTTAETRQQFDAVFGRFLGRRGLA